MAAHLLALWPSVHLPPQTITRYHVLTSYLLCDAEPTLFSRQQNKAQATQSLTSLFHLYQDGLISPDEPEFRSYFLLLLLAAPEFPRELAKLTPAVRAAPPIRCVVALANAFACNDWVAFFRVIRTQATYLQACLLMDLVRSPWTCQWPWPWPWSLSFALLVPCSPMYPAVALAPSPPPQIARARVSALTALVRACPEMPIPALQRTLAFHSPEAALLFLTHQSTLVLTAFLAAPAAPAFPVRSRACPCPSLISQIYPPLSPSPRRAGGDGPRLGHPCGQVPSLP